MRSSMGNSKDTNSPEIDANRLLNDQEFADLMEAELKATGGTAATSIDEIAKQRNWKSITAAIDTQKSVSGQKWIKNASIAAVFVAALGTTFYFRQSTNSHDDSAGIKGIAKAGNPASVAIFKVSTGQIFTPVTDGLVQKNTELVFRTSSSLPGFTGVLVIPETGPIELFLNESPQTPPNEPTVIENGAIVTYTATDLHIAVTACAIAANTADEVRQLGQEIKSHPTPLTSGLLDPESSCAKIVVSESAP